MQHHVCGFRRFDRRPRICESAGFLRFGGTDPEREEIWSWRAGGALTKRTAEVNV